MLHIISIATEIMCSCKLHNFKLTVEDGEVKLRHLPTVCCHIKHIDVIKFNDCRLLNPQFFFLKFNYLLSCYETKRFIHI